MNLRRYREDRWGRKESVLHQISSSIYAICGVLSSQCIPSMHAALLYCFMLMFFTFNQG